MKKLQRNVAHVSRARKRRKIKVKRRFYAFLFIVILLIALLIKNVLKDDNKKSDKGTELMSKTFITETNKVIIASDTKTRGDLQKIKIKAIDFSYIDNNSKTIITLTLINNDITEIVDTDGVAIIKNIYGGEIDRIKIKINFLGVGEETIINILSDKRLTTIAGVELIKQ